MTEPTDWIGGQLTSQAVPPDEHPWIEQFGRNASYQALRQGIRDEYRRHYPLTAEARATRYFNPGNGGVSQALPRAKGRPGRADGHARALCIERAAAGAARARADPCRSPGRSGSGRHGPRPQYRPASDRWSLPIFSTRPSWATCCRWPASSSSPEPRDRSRPASRTLRSIAQPDNQQAITCCFAVDYLDGQDHTIDRPAEYDFWRDFVPALKPTWPGRLLDLTYSDPITLKPVTRGFDPRGAGSGLWVYRRIIDPRNFQPGTYPGSSGTTLVNWPQNDYWLGPLIGATITPGRGRAPHRACQTAQPVAPLLAPDRMPPTRRQDRLEGTAAPTRPGRNRRRPGQGPVHPRIAADPGRVHRPRAARRHRDSPQVKELTRCYGRAIFRQRRRRQLSDRLAPQHRRQQLHRHQLAAVSDSAGRLDPATGRKPAAGLQEPGHDPHHQRLLPLAPRRMGHRRGRRGTGGLCLGAEGVASIGPEFAQTPGRVPSATGGSGRRDRLAADHAALESPHYEFLRDEIELPRWHWKTPREYN